MRNNSLTPQQIQSMGVVPDTDSPLSNEQLQSMGVIPDSDNSMMGDIGNIFAEAASNPLSMFTNLLRTVSPTEIGANIGGFIQGAAQPGAMLDQWITGTRPQTQFLSPSAQNLPGVSTAQKLGTVAELAPLAPATEGVTAAGLGLTEASPWIARTLAGLGADVGSGALTGATFSPQDRLAGGLSGAGMGLIGGGIGRVAIPSVIAGAQNLSPLIKNKLTSFILNRLKAEGANPNSVTLSPEETADNLSQNNILSTGEQLPTDIGTATNDPLLTNLFEGLKKMPFTGAQAFENGSKVLGLNDQINNVQSKLAILSDPMGPEEGIFNANQLYSNMVPSDDLSRGISLQQQLSNNVQNLHNQIKTISDLNYQPINQAQNLRLDNLVSPQQLSSSEFLPNYTSEALNLQSQRANLQNVFNDDDDFSGLLRNELDKSDNLLENGNNVPLTLGEAQQRMQTLGMLQRAAFNKGKYNEARMLGNLNNSFQTDIHTILQGNGFDDLSKQLANANSYFQNNIVPFRVSPLIRKAVTGQQLPKDTSLSSYLLGNDPAAQFIRSQMPQSDINTAMVDRITGGKGLIGVQTPSGFTINQTAPEDIASGYAKLPDIEKLNFSQRNPAAHNSFTMLPDLLSNQNDINQTQASLEDQLKNLQQERFTLGQPEDKKSSIWEKGIKVAGAIGAATHPHILGALAGIATPVTGLARSLTDVLTDPAVLKAYINGEHVPTVPYTQIPGPRFTQLPPGNNQPIQLPDINVR